MGSACNTASLWGPGIVALKSLLQCWYDCLARDFFPPVRGPRCWRHAPAASLNGTRVSCTKKKAQKKGGSPILPLFPVCTEINQTSCQCWDCARNRKVKFLAPCSKNLLFLLSVEWRGIRCQSEELERSKDVIEVDSQMEVLHIIFSINKLDREWKLIFWGVEVVGGCGLCQR